MAVPDPAEKAPADLALARVAYALGRWLELARIWGETSRGVTPTPEYPGANLELLSRQAADDLQRAFDAAGGVVEKGGDVHLIRPIDGQTALNWARGVFSAVERFATADQMRELAAAHDLMELAMEAPPTWYDPAVMRLPTDRERVGRFVFEERVKNPDAIMPAILAAVAKQLRIKVTSTTALRWSDEYGENRGLGETPRRRKGRRKKSP